MQPLLVTKSKENASPIISELTEVLMNNSSKFWNDKETSKKLIVFNYNNFYLLFM